MTRTRMSAKGEIVLPKAMREAHGFADGTEFEVIDDGQEITLRPVAAAAPRKKTLTVEEFLAKRIPYAGPDITDEMIRQGIEEEARHRMSAALLQKTRSWLSTAA